MHGMKLSSHVGRRLLIVIIIFSLLYNEFFSYSLSPLFWQKLHSSESAGDQVRVLFVADPQLVGLLDESQTFGFITRWDCDRFISRTFSRAADFVKPDVVVYMGDLFDEGSKAPQSDYTTYVQRFRAVFSTARPVQEVYIAGDNDVGGEGFDVKTDWKVERFNNFVNASKSGVTKVKFVDFLTLNWDFGEMYAAQLQRHIAHMVNNSSARYRVILNHMNILVRDPAEYNKLISQAEPSLLVTAHTHKDLVMTCLNCLDMNGQFHPFATRSAKSDLIKLELNGHSLNEIVVPTCSYRMGVPHMGYGAAIIERNGEMTYTILWSPSRSQQLIVHLGLLILVILICAWTLLRHIAHKCRYRF